MIQIALLRGINVGGQKKVAMADLRGVFTALGFTDVRTLLQSGNVVFRGGNPKGARLENLLERETERRLGLVSDFFVRTDAEWKSVVAQNPFSFEADHDPARLIVLFLREPPDATHVAALRAAITGREAVSVHGRVGYAVYPDGQGRSRLTNAAIEKALGTRCTARNWNTVLKLHAECERA